MIQQYKTIDLVGGLRADYPALSLPRYARASKRPARQCAFRPRRLAAVLLALAAALICAHVASAAPPPPRRAPCPPGYVWARKVRMWGATPVVYRVCLWRGLR